MPELTRDGDVFVLDLGDGENRFNPGWVGAVMAALGEVEAAEGPRALVTTARGKIWSNGLDLEWMVAHPAELEPFMAEVHALLGRLLGAGVYTVAAIQGHCFAAGAMLALAHDQRVMRVDRGFLCLPEIDIDIPFTPGMSALVQARMRPQVAHMAMSAGRRYGGKDAQEAELVDEAVAEELVLGRALELATARTGSNPATLRSIKRGMYAPALALLEDPAANRISVPGLTSG
jgi:enoyl-CoA hydratase/carnithine racemase